MLVRCPDCHEMAETMVVDNGIGPYEFWGRPGWHTQLEVVTNCCEAPVDVTIEEAREHELRI